ncbi:MAG TPA: DUF979 domain-containing protein [Tetragenococcus sp.]|nr:DUF979 domain-containing protein [Tetragenococcus sp.]
MNFFLDPAVLLSEKLLEIMYIIMGLMVLYTGIKNLKDKSNPNRIGTAIFWCSLAIVLIFGRFIPAVINGVIIVIMTLPPILKKVNVGKEKAPLEEYTKKMSERLGMKIFIPALSIGICAILFALFTDLGALVGIMVGVLVSIILLMIFSDQNKPHVFLDDSERMLSTVGPLSMLPMLLASLGTIFTEAGVGDVISDLVAYVIPKGNVNLGIIVFAIGMALFTMVMGNAFAAITVMTVGVGAPFVLDYGADPVLIGMLALTCGYCGTLCTPMAANFNIVPVAMLEMKDRFGVIKNQVVLAVIFLVFQIGYMILFK